MKITADDDDHDDISPQMISQRKAMMSIGNSADVVSLDTFRKRPH
jgi:hypothetical protein